MFNGKVTEYRIEEGQVMVVRKDYIQADQVATDEAGRMATLDGERLTYRG